jgi:diguanylate cyclase (GGDEF)-like protein
MKRRQGLRLRFLVVALVVFSIWATLGASTYIAYRTEKEALTRLTLEMNQINSDKIAESVDGLFASMKKSLAATGDYFVRNRDQIPLADQLELFRLNHPEFNSIVLVDEKGKLLESSPANAALKGQIITTEGTVQALREKRPLVSEPYISTLNRLVVVVSHPLVDEKGAYRGFIGGSIWLQEENLLSKLLSTSPNDENGSYMYVVSSSGNLLYHPDSSRNGENVNDNPVVKELKSGHSGKMRLHNSRGIEMLASYTALKETGWGVVAQTPTESVNRDTKKLVLLIPLYTLPIMVVFIFAISLMIGKVADPLVKLARYAARLSYQAGAIEPVPRIHDWNFEANQLHRALTIAVRQVGSEFDSLSHEANTDPLTGLYNRRVLEFYTRTWIGGRVPFSLLLIDLDHFKRINDTFGHDIGDEVLKFLAQAVRSLTEERHMCCRFGGEEFVVLMPDTAPELALVYAETIRAYMEATDSPAGRPVTLSIGIAAYPEDADDAEQLFRLADEALYRAKGAGRNRIEYHLTWPGERPKRAK